jgi:hypothetical protein
MKTDHSDTLQKSQAAKQGLKATLTRVQRAFEASFENIPSYLLCARIAADERVELTRLVDPPDIISLMEPGVFHARLRKTLEAFSAPDAVRSFGNPSDVFYCHLLTRTVTFRRYRGLSPHLSVFDSALSDYLSRPRDALFVRGVDAEGQQLLLILPLFDSVGKDLIKVCQQDTDPLTTLSQFGRVIGDISELLRIHITGANARMTDLLNLVLAYINPPHLASLFGFLVDFLLGPALLHERNPIPKIADEDFNAGLRLVTFVKDICQRGSKICPNAWVLSRYVQQQTGSWLLGGTDEESKTAFKRAIFQQGEGSTVPAEFKLMVLRSFDRNEWLTCLVLRLKSRPDEIEKTDKAVIAVFAANGAVRVPDASTFFAEVHKKFGSPPTRIIFAPGHPGDLPAELRALGAKLVTAEDTDQQILEAHFENRGRQ